MWLAKREIQLLIEWIQRAVDVLRCRVGFKSRVIRANLVLSLLHRFESPCGEKSENRGTKTDDAFAWHKNWPPQNVGVDLIQYVVFLRNATGIDHAFYVHAVFGHAIQDDSSVKGSAFDGREELILGGALQVPTESNAS